MSSLLQSPVAVWCDGIQDDTMKKATRRGDRDATQRTFKPPHLRQRKHVRDQQRTPAPQRRAQAMAVARIDGGRGRHRSAAWVIVRSFGGIRVLHNRCIYPRGGG